MNCRFCSREILNKGSLAAHEKCCKSNPDAIKHPHSPYAGRKPGSTAWNKDKRFGINLAFREKFPDEAVFIKNSSYPRHCIKRRIREDDLIPYVCACCGIGPEWQGEPMPLVLDHINGINNDNRLENLRFVCSNCDTQLDTYKSKNKGRAIR